MKVFEFIDYAPFEHERHQFSIYPAAIFLFEVIANGNELEIEDYPDYSAPQPASLSTQLVNGQFVMSEFRKNVSH